jgi:hypothetical protein
MNLDFLRPLYEHTGGYVSVYLDTSLDHPEAPHEVALRWRSAREQLAVDGADERTLDAVAAVLADRRDAAPGRAVFGRGGAVLLTEALSGPPRTEIARLAPLPHVLPMLAKRRLHVPHLRVTARHDGGEIAEVTAVGAEQPEQVKGTGWPVHKASAGGWSEPRFERSTEEAWEVNAKELAAQVTAAAGKINARLILLGGDVRARSLVLDHLGSELAASTVVIDREVPAESEAAARAAAQAIAARAAEQARERFAVWQTEQAHQRGVAGWPATIAALRDGEVAEVLLAEDAPAPDTAWIGPEGSDLALSAADLTERGVREPVTDRADAALVRALATTSAQLWFLPVDLSDDAAAAGGSGAVLPQDGICALLRYPAA